MKTGIILIILHVIVTFGYGQDINKGVTAYWDFETLDGDLSKNKGSLINAKLVDTNLNNKALQLMGKNSYLQINNGLDLFNHFSIIFWINFIDLNHTSTIINQSNSNGRLLKLDVDKNNFILSCNDEFNNKNIIFSNKHKMITGKWYFIAIEAKNSNLSMQIDTTTIIQIDDLNLNIREKQDRDNLTIGTSFKSEMLSFSGLIDEFIVYNRELSDTEKKILLSKVFPKPIVEPRKPPTINGREAKIDSSFTIDTEKINIVYFDNDKVDNDMISIYFNGEIIVKEEVLTKKRKKITLNIEPYKNNYLSLFAHNLGTYPPNTARVIVHINNRKYELSLKSDFSQNATLQFVYIPKDE
jgi:hypothetical protein